MAIFHLDYRLADFDRWLSLFASGELREEIEHMHGVETVRVLRDKEELQHAIVVMRADTREAIDRMLGHPRLQEWFADGSIFVTPPHVVAGYALTELEPYEVGENPAFFVDHRLANFDKFREGLMNRTGQSAVKPIKLLQDIEDRNNVRLVILASEKAVLEHAMAQRGLQEHFANRDIFCQAPEIVFSPTSVFP